MPNHPSNLKSPSPLQKRIEEYPQKVHGFAKSAETLRLTARLLARIQALRHDGGTSLSLAITERLVTMFGRRIWVKSKLGLGRTLHVTASFVRQKRRAWARLIRQIERLSETLAAIVATPPVASS